MTTRARIVGACLAIAALAFVLALATAYQRSDRAARSASSPPVAATAPTAPPAASVDIEARGRAGLGEQRVASGDSVEARAARERLVQAFDKLGSAYPYRFTDTSAVTLRIGFHVPPTTSVTELAAADRRRVIWTRGSDRGEIVTVGGRTFLKAGDQWHVTARDAGAIPPDAAPGALSGSGLDRSALEHVEAVGAETLDGVSTSAYRFTFVWKALGMRFGGSGTAWIRVADGLPHRTDLKLHAPGIDMTSRLRYEYGVPIEIAPPLL